VADEHRVESVDATLRSLKATQIDVAILSHPHDDHVRNFIALIEGYRWKINLVVMSARTGGGGRRRTGR